MVTSGIEAVEFRPVIASDQPLLQELAYLAAPFQTNGEFEPGQMPSFNEAMAMPDVQSVFDGWGRKKDIGVVASVGEVGVAAAWSRRYLSSPSQMLTMGVREGYQGQGIGEASLRSLLGVARARGIAVLGARVIKRNVRAINLYEKVGFEVVEDAGEEVVRSYQVMVVNTASFA